MHASEGSKLWVSLIVKDESLKENRTSEKKARWWLE